MIEILLILLIIAAALLLPWIGGWDPELLLLVISVILNLINLAMTVINIFQSLRKDPRFLNGALLGGVQVLIGLGLLALFRFTLGGRPETWACSLPFIAGGTIALLSYFVGKTRTTSSLPRSSDPQES